jgi:predicted DNA-binding protein YlxM (UPF0122 family)
MAKKTTKIVKKASVLRGIDDNADFGLLNDYYGQLLTNRQREIFVLYYEEDYSLGEIATLVKISRQGVHEALRTAKAKLIEFEKSLGLIAKHNEYIAALKDIEATASKLIADEAIAKIKDKKDSDRIKRYLRKIRKTASDLDI